MESVFFPLRHILAVGAYKDECAYGRTDNPDSRDLTRMVDFLMAQGLVRRDPDGKPHIVVETMNLVDGQDYLKGHNPCDVLMICYVPGAERRYQNPYEYNTMQAEFERKSGAKPSRDFRVSPHHYPEHWRNAAARSNAKIIWTIGDSRDMSIDTFAHAKSRPIDVIQRPSTWPYVDDREDKPGKFGIPGRWHGVGIFQGYADMVARSNSPETPFKQELKYNAHTREIKNSHSLSGYIKAWARDHWHVEVG